MTNYSNKATIRLYFLSKFEFSTISKHFCFCLDKFSQRCIIRSLIIISSTKQIGSHIFKFEKIQVLFSSPTIIKIKLSPMSTSCQILNFQLFQNIFVFASTIFCQCCIIFDHIISCTKKLGHISSNLKKYESFLAHQKLLK